MRATSVAGGRLLLSCAVAAALASLVACKKNTAAVQKNFVARTGEGYVHLVAWPAYDIGQAKAFVGFTSKARSHDELFAQVRQANLSSLLSPEMCWFGKATPERLSSHRLGEVYLGKQLELSSERSVSCPSVMAAMRAKPALQNLAARLETKANEAGVDACVYLTFALTPRFGSLLLSRMRQRGLATAQEVDPVLASGDDVIIPAPPVDGGNAQ